MINIIFKLKNPVEMNTIYVVNLVVCVGFTVQFCIHVAMNFERQKGLTKRERSMRTMFDIGSTVVKGMVAPKVIGIFVFLFSPNTVVRIYFFRMYLCMILIGQFNGLCTFPLILSKIGPGKDYTQIKQREAERDMLRAKAKQERLYFE
jgi:Niemann-Pick C1 protein